MMRRNLTRLALAAVLAAISPVARAAAGDHSKVRFTSAGQAKPAEGRLIEALVSRIRV